VANTGELTLDRINIRHGNCNGACASEPNSGGGISNFGTLRISNSVISENRAEKDGGGIYNFSAALFINFSRLSRNYAAMGGGIATLHPGPVVIRDAEFYYNTAVINGGGLYNHDYSPLLERITFYTNTAQYGGAIYNNSSSPNMINATLARNSAQYGGAIYNFEHSDTQLLNVTITENSAAHSGGGMYNENSWNPILTNVILWNNNAPVGPEVHNDLTSSPTINYSVVQGGCPAGSTCSTVFNADPLLGPLAENGGDFTYTMALGAGSPAIDTGTNTGCPYTDQRGVIRPQGTHCDIGAYEFEVDAIPPSPSSITRVDDSPTGSSSVDFVVTFSKSVTNVDVDDFIPIAKGVKGATITNVSGAGDTYIVTVHTGSGNGTIRLSVPVTATITDLAGNPLSGLPFTSGEFYIIAKQPNKPIDVPTPPTPLQ
jgi:hypothetical protein